ncbi:MAG: hypothetical protein PWP72_1419 [Thermoanaerobacter sp.]|nr:hypothetical protein [Thermoanaerobacter sp.]
MSDSDKVVSIFRLREKALSHKAQESDLETSIQTRLDEFTERLLGLIDPDRRRTKATVYAANHARQWAEEGTRLQALREQAGVTRSALAKALGVSPQRLARLEMGLPVVDAKLLRAAYLLFFENLAGRFQTRHSRATCIKRR